MKFIFTIFIVGFLSVVNAQPMPDSSLEDAVREIALAVHDVDQQKLSHYIHPRIGVFIPYKIGIPPVIDHESHIDIHALSQMRDTFWPVTLKAEEGIQRFLNSTQFHYTTTITSHCEDDAHYVLEGQPLQVGIYLTEDNLLSTLLQQLVAFWDYPEAMEEISGDFSLDKIRALEANGYRVIIRTGADTLAFSVTQIEGRWYLWLIDRYTLDCSA